MEETVVHAERMVFGLPAAEAVLYGILAITILENVFELYLQWRQIRVYKTNTVVPHDLKSSITEEQYNKARLYGLDNANYGMFKGIIMDIIVACFELYFGFIAYLWATGVVWTKYCGFDTSNEIIVSCMFMQVVNLVNFVKDLPFKIFKIFILEEKHGFNKQTPWFFVKDQLKGIVVSSVLMTPIVSGIIYIVQIGGEHFFIWLWCFTGIISLVLLTIYPIFIAPLFDKYTPLEQGPLRQSIEELAASLHFPLTKLYVVEGSKRSAHSNAYFYGLWNSKRIVLFDTLLLNKGKADDSELKDDEKGKGCTNEEVVAVLGHELGHWKLGHVTKNIIMIQTHLLLMFMAFGYFFKYEPFYEAVGFESGTCPILVGLLIVLTYVLAPYNAIVNFGMTIMSRYFEYQADAFAHSLGYSKGLKDALIKLNIDNLGFWVYDWLYSSWNHSHPTLLQRLSRLEELDKADDEQKKQKKIN